MGFRYRRSVKILPGVKLNFSKSGVSTTVGGRYGRTTFSQHGVRNRVRNSVRTPIKGLSYTTYKKYGTQGTGCLLLILLIPAFLLGLHFAHGSELPTPTPKIEAAFSPRAGALELAVKAINSAQQSIRLSAYSFTSPQIVSALVSAERRGVDVKVVVDYKENIELDRSGKAKAALNLLVNAGIPTRTIGVYKIHHDKFMIIDGKTVETGSFNYTTAADRYNSENLLVVWNDADLAR
jgi:hypothetical protein